MFELLTGETPFTGKTILEVEEKLRNERLPIFKLNRFRVTECAKDLLTRMLEKNWNTRISAIECLTHPWLNPITASVVEVPRDIVENLRVFRSYSPIRNVFLNMIAHQLSVSGPQIRKINDAFRCLDKDGNGTLSKQELGSGLLKCGVAPREIRQILHSLDVDQSETVSYTEFLAACYSWKESEVKVMWTAFSKMDLNNDGKITVEELIQCLTNMISKGRHASRGTSVRLINYGELSRLVKEMDKNNDGVIDWQEFASFMRE